MESAPPLNPTQYLKGLGSRPRLSSSLTAREFLSGVFTAWLPGSVLEHTVSQQALVALVDLFVGIQCFLFVQLVLDAVRYAAGHFIRVLVGASQGLLNNLVDQAEFFQAT